MQIGKGLLRRVPYASRFVTLHGQAALITGGGGGIGSACALRLASDGAAVVLVGRTLATLEAARQQITTEVGDARIESFAGDALDEATLAAAFERARMLADRTTMAIAV